MNQEHTGDFGVRLLRSLYLSLLTLTMALSGCVPGGCTEVGGIPLITLVVPQNAIVVEFCVDGFDCTKNANPGEGVDVWVDDEDRFDYTYTATVQIDGQVAEFAGDITTDPLFPNGERCGRSGKTGTITVIDTETVETSG